MMTSWPIPPWASPAALPVPAAPAPIIPEGNGYLKRIAEIYEGPYRVWLSDMLTCKCERCVHARSETAFALTHSPANPDPWSYYHATPELHILYASEIAAACGRNDYNHLIETLKNLEDICPESGRTYYFSIEVLLNTNLSVSHRIMCLHAFLAGIVLDRLGSDAVFEIYRDTAIGTLLDFMRLDDNLKRVLLDLKPAFVLWNEHKRKKEISNPTWMSLLEFTEEEDANKLVAYIMRKSLSMCEKDSAMATFIKKNIAFLKKDALKRRGPAVLMYYHARSRNSVDGCDCIWCEAKRARGR